MLFPLLVVGSAVAASLGAAKLAAEATVAAGILGVRKKNKEAERNFRLDINPEVHSEDSFQLVSIPAEAMPEFPELSGEWLMLKTELGRLDKALEQRFAGVETEDLKRLSRARAERSQDPVLQVVISAQRAELQKGKS
jgi:hypothetical protein